MPRPPSPGADAPFNNPGFSNEASASDPIPAAVRPKKARRFKARTASEEVAEKDDHMKKDDHRRSDFKAKMIFEREEGRGNFRLINANLRLPIFPILR